MRKYAACLLVFAAALAACGGTGSSPNAGGVPPCPLGPIPAPPQLIYPAANATNVPVTNFAVEVTYQNGSLTSQWSTPALTAPGAPKLTGAPYAIVPTPGAYEYTSSFPVLQSSTTYTIQVVNPPEGGQCSSTATLGSFTTQ